MTDSPRRRSPWRFLFLALAVLSGAWLAFYGALQLLARHLLTAGDQAGLGVIGGADGPTAVFVAVSPGFDWDLIIMAAVLIVGVAGYVRLCRCKQKK